MGIRINILYGALVSGDDHPTTAFSRKYTIAFFSDKGAAIRDIIMQHAARATAEQRQLFASALCFYVLKSAFSDDILEIDSNNTYNAFNVQANDTSTLVYDKIAGLTAYKTLVRYLDQDIKDKIPPVPTWIDVAGAASLQILRELIV